MRGRRTGPRRRPAPRPRAARLRQRALARLPPGAARADPRPGRHVLDLARADVRRRRPARPRQLPGARPRHLRRDGAGRGHLRRRVPLPAPRRPAAGATPTPTRWARRWSRPRPTPASGSPCSTPATSPAASTAAGHLPLDGVQLRFSDGDADAWAARVAALPERDGLRIGAAVHSVRAVPADQLATVVAGRGRSAAARPRLRAARRERGLRGVLRLHPHAGCSPTAGVLGPGHHRRARHPPDRRRRRAARAAQARRSAPARAPRPTSPTASGRSAGCGTPARRCAWAATSTRRPTCSPRPGCSRRSSGWPPASAAGSARPSSSTPSPSTATARSAGRTPGASRPGSGPTWSPSGWTARAPPAAPPISWSWPPAPPTCTPWSSTAGSWSPTGSTCSATSAGSWPSAIEPLWEDA